MQAPPGTSVFEPDGVVFWIYLTLPSSRRRCTGVPWCDEIPTPSKNQPYPNSEHSCAHRNSHDCGTLLGASNHRKTGVVMNRLPLDVQRRHKRRWTARFSEPAKPIASRKQTRERKGEQIAGAERAEEKPEVKPTGLTPRRPPSIQRRSARSNSLFKILRRRSPFALREFGKARLGNLNAIRQRPAPAQRPCLRSKEPKMEQRNPEEPTHA